MGITFHACKTEMLEFLKKHRVRQLINRAQQLRQRDPDATGRPIAEEAYQLSLGGLKPDASEYVLSAALAGLARSEAGDKAGAEVALTDALRFAATALKGDSVHHAAILNNLSILYMRTGRAKMAIPLMRQALEIKRSHFGRGDLRYADNLQDLILAFEDAGDYGAAEPYLREMVEIVRKNAGADDPEYARALENLALACRRVGKDAEASDLRALAEEIKNKARGSGRESESLVDAAKRKYRQGDYDGAQELYRQILAQTPQLPLPGLLNSAMGNMLDPLREFADQLEKEGLKAEEEGRFDDASLASRQRLEMFRVSFGEHHHYVAFAMSNLAEALRKAKRFDEAKPLLLDAVSRIGEADFPQRKVLLANVARLFIDICNARAPDAGHNFDVAIASMEEKPPEYARSMRIRLPLPKDGENPVQSALRWIDARARFYQSIGDRVLTRFLLEAAVEMARAVAPREATEPIVALWKFYLESGQLNAAVDLFDVLKEQSIDDRRSTSEIAELLMQEADVLSKAGNHEAAEKLLTTALALVSREYGAESPVTLSFEENLAIVRMRLGRPDTKEDLRRLVGRYHSAGFEDAWHLQRLASYLSQLGDYSEAEVCYGKVLKSQSDEIGEWDPAYALTLSNLATVYRLTGRFEEAEPLYRLSIEIRKTEYGPHHSTVMDSLIRLALTVAALGRWKDAFEAIREAMTIGDLWLGQLSGLASESTRLNLIREQLQQVNVAVSILYAAQDGSLAGEIFEWVLRRKALGLTALAGLRTAVLSGRYPPLLGKLRELDSLKTELVRQLRVDSGPDADFDASAMEEAFLLKGELESELARSIPEMKLEQVMDTATVASVAAALPADSALVEYVVFDPHNFAGIYATDHREKLPKRCIAFVLHTGDSGSLKFVDLGEVNDLGELISDLTHSTALLPRALSATPDAGGAEETAPVLAQRFVWPLLPLIGTSRRLLLAPDGQLCLLPFDILPLADGRLVIDEYELSYLGTGRDALRFMEPTTESKSGPLIIADPDFDLSASNVVPAGDLNTDEDERRERVARSFARGAVKFPPLPGTRLESERISAVMPGAVAKVGGSALESDLRQLVSPAILQLATHGFFTRFGTAGTNSDLRRAMYSSGLALAGANSFLAGRPLPPAAEDGILTAEDVATLNLLDTELVVLSACDTAVGEILDGEGVFGLRRAFFIAGARTIVMSLWKVPDIETAELMASFYSYLGRGVAKPNALRRAKLDRRVAGAPAAAWAAFICEGDWGLCSWGSESTVASTT